MTFSFEMGLQIFIYWRRLVKTHGVKILRTISTEISRIMIIKVDEKIDKFRAETLQFTKNYQTSPFQRNYSIAQIRSNYRKMRGTPGGSVLYEKYSNLG